ncbi:hypothetical protein KCTC52924_00990 [Arenibacter antarcticus]|uniref:Uncharacterized protein n=1 Tax=Arenibacter antarcticus TaxID=2040469 RepID=A0ABW5VAL8_9FLAO|nr:hypothetical protein [Arenibacter sp. H213]MCM4167511.1 hypothetical protein [Arenibacter sp. H213]
MKVAAYYKILLFVLFLGLGRVAMATTQVQPEDPVISDYGVHKNDHQNFGDIPTFTTILLQESNPELPSASDFKLPSHHTKNYRLLVDRNPLTIYKKRADITVSLDSLTLIFPFHTFF